MLAAFLQPLAVDLPVQQLRLHLKRDGIEATAVRRLLGHDPLQLRDELVELDPATSDTSPAIERRQLDGSTLRFTQGDSPGSCTVQGVTIACTRDHRRVTSGIRVSQVRGAPGVALA